MTPELEQRLQSMQSKLDALTDMFRQFETASQLNPLYIRAISQAITNSTNKVASSENQAVNESGSSSYSVLKPPDRFIKIGDNNVPAYD